MGRASMRPGKYKLTADETTAFRTCPAYGPSSALRRMWPTHGSSRLDLICNYCNMELVFEMCDDNVFHLGRFPAPTILEWP